MEESVPLPAAQTDLTACRYETGSRQHHPEEPWEPAAVSVLDEHPSFPEAERDTPAIFDTQRIVCGRECLFMDFVKFP